MLKREWHGMRVRVSDTALRASLPGAGELFYDADQDRLMVDWWRPVTDRDDATARRWRHVGFGEPFELTSSTRELVRTFLDLIENYERWVEAREGRDERIARTARSSASRDRRSPYNPLAETRRVHRLLIPRTRRSR